MFAMLDELELDSMPSLFLSPQVMVKLTWARNFVSVYLNHSISMGFLWSILSYKVIVVVCTCCVISCRVTRAALKVGGNGWWLIMVL